MCGATVYIHVPAKDVGPFLHRLEYVADVSVVGDTYYLGQGYGVIQLRSDRFVADWQGIEVRVVEQPGEPMRFVPVQPGESYRNAAD